MQYLQYDEWVGIKTSVPNRDSLLYGIYRSGSIHTSLEVPVGQKKRTFDTTYLELLWTYWGFIFYPWANQIQRFLRTGDTQAKWSVKYGPNRLCVLTATSEEAGFFICLWVKNEFLVVGPQQPQISDIKSS